VIKKLTTYLVTFNCLYHGLYFCSKFKKINFCQKLLQPGSCNIVARYNDYPKILHTISNIYVETNLKNCTVFGETM